MIAAACLNTLETEWARWFLWTPVLFAAGIVAYFSLSQEPSAVLAAAVLTGAVGIALAVRFAALGTLVGGAALAIALGFAAGKVRTELVRAHILAISGMHMVIMAGTWFWLVRGGLALFPSLVLRYPIRKWAAGAALLGALFYLAFSGAAVPTVRAWIMMSIMLLGRPAITMRNVALAALIILAWTPEVLFSPSFQMSFAAVVGLVAVYEGNAQRFGGWFGAASWYSRAVRFVWLAILGTALTTLVASLAIAPFAAYHFHRLAQPISSPCRW